jgi:hypothetical protein
MAWVVYTATIVETGELSRSMVREDLISAFRYDLKSKDLWVYFPEVKFKIMHIKWFDSAQEANNYLMYGSSI